uniref:CWH43-like N-terminal domain-containing protein n=1 Tax=Glossina brevipalpis TaxID=37001 RepID=A0A1A9VZE8_9MUSC
MLEKMQTKMQPERLANINSMITMILRLKSNRENYPVHEKIFITFMICSLWHMLATIKLNGILNEDHIELSQTQRDSIQLKKILFAVSIISTVGLLIFFAKHRFYCHNLAFSWFALLFHFTVILDFPCQHMLHAQKSKRFFEIPPRKWINQNIIYKELYEYRLTFLLKVPSIFALNCTHPKEYNKHIEGI